MRSLQLQLLPGPRGSGSLVNIEVEDHQLRDEFWVCDGGEGGEQAEEAMRGNELQALVSVLTV